MAVLFEKLKLTSNSTCLAKVEFRNYPADLSENCGPFGFEAPSSSGLGWRGSSPGQVRLFPDSFSRRGSKIKVSGHTPPLSSLRSSRRGGGRVSAQRKWPSEEAKALTAVDRGHE